MRKKNSIKNLLYGLLCFAITTAMGFVIPRLFLLSFGSEVNGLISSVRQIFVYFSLLEAGVGLATRQALYGPVANRDVDSISAIMSATNKFYRKTGTIYAIAVVVLAVFYPLFIKTEIPAGIIFWIILFQGEGGVIKYFITGKLRLLINVDGKAYILGNIETLFSIASNIVRITLLSIGAGVLWVQGLFCVVDLLQVLVIVGYFKKYYHWVDFHAAPDMGALKKKNSVLVHEISGLIFHNTDTLILSVFCGLKTVSVYTIYLTIYGIIANIIGYFSSSISFAMGQLFHSNRNRFEAIQECFETLYLLLSFSLFTIAYLFITPFLEIYTSGVTDIKYIDNTLPVLFLVYQLLYYGRIPSGNIINYAGHFKETQGRSIFESCINIVVSLVGVHFLGIYGVVIGTIAALLYRTNDMIIYANRRVLNHSCLPTYRRWLRNIVLSMGCSQIKRVLPQSYSSYLSMLIYAAGIGLLVFCVFLVTNLLAEKAIWSTLNEYLEPILLKLKIKIGDTD